MQSFAVSVVFHGLDSSAVSASAVHDAICCVVERCLNDVGHDDGPAIAVRRIWNVDRSTRSPSILRRVSHCVVMPNGFARESETHFRLKATCCDVDHATDCVSAIENGSQTEDENETKATDCVTAVENESQTDDESVVAQ